MFLRAQADKAGPESDRLFRCPACGQEELEKEGSSLSCVNCGRDWPIEDGIYDFGM